MSLSSSYWTSYHESPRYESSGFSSASNSSTTTIRFRKPGLSLRQAMQDTLNYLEKQCLCGAKIFAPCPIQQYNFLLWSRMHKSLSYHPNATFQATILAAISISSPFALAAFVRAVRNTPFFVRRGVPYGITVITFLEQHLVEVAIKSCTSKRRVPDF